MSSKKNLVALNEEREATEILSKLKSVAEKAFYYSNSCVHVSTSEWVGVRIMAARTFMLEKNFDEAIHILTYLCYVIPPDMLKLGRVEENLT